MNNSHVILYYRLLCLQAEAYRRPLAQLHWYTMAMKESGPEWRPPYLLKPRQHKFR